MPIPIPGGFADVEDTFDVLPAGTYSAVVAEGEVREAGPDAKHPGAQYIAWTFNIEEEGFKNRKAWLNTSLVPEAKAMLKRFLLATGFSDEDLNREDFEFDIDDVTGRRVRLVITQGTNPRTKEKNNSVKRVLAPSADEEEDDLP